MNTGRSRLLLALLAAVLLVPWPGSSITLSRSSISAAGRLAAAQGLSLSSDQLEVHVKAAAAGFAVHQDLLHLAGQANGNTGLGKATGSAAASFNSPASMRQLQQAFHNLAASPRVYNSYDRSQTPAGQDLAPRMRDQGPCSTSVAHAVAAAAEAALAAAMHKDAAGVSVNPQFLHYCGEAGRMCNSSWSVGDALEYVVMQAPELLRPTSCGSSSSSTNSSTNNSISTASNSSISLNPFDDTSNEPRVQNWDKLCAAAQQQCSSITRSTPWLRCSYKPLKTYWQIQQHIRNHGAVISLMAVYDDLHADNSSSRANGEPRVYSPGAQAKILSGQAVLIVGYDDVQQTWSVLSSWGASSSNSSSEISNTSVSSYNSRSHLNVSVPEGVLQVKMGTAGIGTPGETYGLECIPAPGSKRDPHSAAVYRSRALRPVQLSPGVPPTRLRTRCYLYSPDAHDDPTSVADGFDLDLGTLAWENREVLHLTPIQFKFQYPQTLDELRNTLRSVESTTRDFVKMGSKRGYFEPHFKCMLMGNYKDTTCTKGNLTACYDMVGEVRKINRACTLVYPDLALSEDVFNGRQQIKVCDISNSVEQPDRFDRVAYVKSPEVSQPRALAAVLEAILGPAGAQQYTIPASGTSSNSSRSYCLPGKYGQKWQSPNAPVRLWPEHTTRYACDSRGYITYMHLNLGTGTQVAGLDNPQLVQAVLSLEKLRVLDVVGGNGQLPPQLGALRELQRLSIRYSCVTGGLPQNYGLDWPRMVSLTITPSNPALVMSNFNTTGGTNSSKGSSYGQMDGMEIATNSTHLCGITGPIPASWGTNLAKATSLKQLVLAGNRLSGQLPAGLGALKSLCTLDLSRNQLTGQLPTAWGMSGMFKRCSLVMARTNVSRSAGVINLSGNYLEGTIPYEWANLGLSKLQLSNNTAMQGCLPSLHNPNTTTLETQNTQLQGVCPKDVERYAIEQQQYTALWDYLPQLFLGPNDTDFVRNHLQQAPENLSSWVPDPVQGVATSSSSDPVTHGRFSLTVTTVDRTAYVTHISAWRVGLNLSVLPALVEKLPRLQAVTARRCQHPDVLMSSPNAAAAAKATALVGAGTGTAVGATQHNTPKVPVSTTPANTLPVELAYKSPASLRTLSLISCDIQGSLPESWGNWSTLEELWVSDNQITGKLPDTWANMTSLRILYAERNQLVGLLPAAWGTGSIPSNIFMNLNTNPALFGQIPPSWSRFEGLIWVEGTSVKGCVPSNMLDNIISDETFARGDIACPSLPTPSLVNTTVPPEDPQLAALLAIRALVGSSYLLSWGSDAATLNGAPPLYCTSWLGVSCNDQYQIQSLNLTTSTQLAHTTQLSELHQHLRQLPALQVLVLAGLNLSGTLPEGLGAVLSSLQHLNISANPGIVGPLPKGWVGLTQLQTLDVSGCAIDGSLPESWAALQHLEVFRAARTAISGELPAAWGLLRSLRVLDISHAKLSGKLPQQWADAEAMQAIAAAKSALTDADAGAGTAANHTKKPVSNTGSGMPKQQHRTVTPALPAKAASNPTGTDSPVSIAVAAAAAVTTSSKVAAALAAVKTAAAAVQAAKAAAVGVTAEEAAEAIGVLSLSFREIQAVSDSAGTAVDMLDKAAHGSDVTVTSALAPQAAMAAGAAEPATTAIHTNTTTSGSQQAPQATTAKGALLASGSAPAAAAPSNVSLGSSPAVPVAANAPETAAVPTAMAAAAAVPEKAPVTVMQSDVAPGSAAAALTALRSLKPWLFSKPTNSYNIGRPTPPAATAAVPAPQAPVATTALSASHGAAITAQSPRTAAVSVASTAGRVPNPTSVPTQKQHQPISHLASAKQPKPAGLSTYSGTFSEDQMQGTMSGNSTKQGLSMSKLEVLKLAGNQLTGSLPEAYRAFTQLKAVDLSSNRLSGSLPLQWAALQNLESLLLASNKLSGTLPLFWARLSNLQTLDVSTNALRGPLPPTWVGMRHVSLLNVSSNQLTGEVPREWLVMTSREDRLCLLLYANQLDPASLAMTKRTYELMSNKLVTVAAQPGDEKTCLSVRRPADDQPPARRRR